MFYAIIDKIKENHWLFSTLMILIMGFVSLMGSSDIKITVLFITFSIGLIVIGVIYYNPLQSVMITWICHFILPFIVYRLLRVSSVPIGIFLEVLGFLGLVVLLFRRELGGHERKIGVFLLIWLALCCIELINPLAASRVAWTFAIRQLLKIIIPYFVIYSLLIHYRHSLKYLLYTWVIMVALTALYTIYQEFFGVLPWVYDAIMANEKAKALLMTFGRLRKFSFLNNPMENGVVQAINAVLCLGLAFKPQIKIKSRIIYIALSILSLWAMMYTGTRTATVILTIGAVVYIVLSRNKLLLVFSTIVFVLGAGYIGATGGGQVGYVMMTAFNPDEDPSMQVRYNNQKILRQYLYRSPMGYGMGSTGDIGMKTAPHTFLGSLPPDSELVRIVVETGPVGLAIYLFIMYKCISVGLDSLKSAQGNFSSNFHKVIIAVLFMFLIGQYPQEILNVNPLKILFGFCLAYISLTENERKRCSWYD